MTRALTIRLDDKVYDMLAAQAEATRRSLANFVVVEILGYAQDNPFERQKRLLDTLHNPAGILKDRVDMEDPIAYLDRLRGGRSAAESEVIKATRLAAIDQLYGLWEDHPVKSPEKYVRALRSKGRAKRLGLR